MISFSLSGHRMIVIPPIKPHTALQQENRVDEWSQWAGGPLHRGV